MDCRLTPASDATSDWLKPDSLRSSRATEGDGSLLDSIRSRICFFVMDGIIIDRRTMPWHLLNTSLDLKTDRECAVTVTIRRMDQTPELLEWKALKSDESGIPRVLTRWTYEAFQVEVVVSIPAAGVVVVQSLTVEADDVTVRMLQRMRLGDLRYRIARATTRDPGVVKLSGSAKTPVNVEGTLTVSPSAGQLAKAKTLLNGLRESPPKRGRGADNSDFYRLIAETYLALLYTAGERQVVKVMAEEIGRPDNTVSRWVHTARKEKWLGPSLKPNRAGGDPGPKLLEWRKEHGE